MPHTYMVLWEPSNAPIVAYEGRGSNPGGFRHNNKQCLMFLCLIAQRGVAKHRLKSTDSRIAMVLKDNSQGSGRREYTCDHGCLESREARLRMKNSYTNCCKVFPIRVMSSSPATLLFRGGVERAYRHVCHLVEMSM